MLLNEKSKRILHLLVHEREVNIPFLLTMLPYSKRTLDYELERIQEWLTHHRFPHVEMDGTTLRIEHATGLLERLEKTELILSDEERELLVIFYALTQEEFLSSVHFQQLLGVSKFTVQESLNAVKKNAVQFGLDFAYTRKEGYRFNGHLQTMYLYLYRSIERLVLLSTKNHLLDAILDEWGNRFQQAYQQIEMYEASRQFRFVESHREKLAYFILLGAHFPVATKFDTQETAFTKNTDSTLGEYFAGDASFMITLDLLMKSGPKTEEELDQEVQEKLSDVMREVIRRFESISCTFIIEQEALCEKLVLHSKATMQRVYTGLEASKELEHYVINEHQVLNVLVERSLEPFRQLLGRTLPDIEVMYYTLHFAAHLHRQGQNLDEKMKAIVVCPSGISVSHMLDHILKNQFPEFIFLPPTSQREIDRYAPLVDLIFTTVPLEDRVHQLADVTLVPTLPTRLEQITLKRTIEQRYLNRGHLSSIQAEDILDLFKQHGTIRNESVLRQKLRMLLHPIQPTNLIYEGGQPMLNQLISEKRTQLHERVSDWEEAMRLAARPLVNDYSIDQSYIETMIENVHIHGPYIVLMPDVAIPHARPEDGVTKLGMSVLKLEQPVQFPGNKPVRLFFVLAAIDQTTHLKALAQLTELLSNSADVAHILAAQSTEDVLTIINKYSEEEER